MLCFLIIFLGALIISRSAASQSQLNDEYSELIDSVVQYLGQEISLQPSNLPFDIQQEDLENVNKELSVSITNVKLATSPTFTVSKLETNAANLTTSIQITFPKVYFVLDFNSGNRSSSEDNDEGRIYMIFNNAAVTGHATFVVSNMSLQISSLDLSYDYKALNFDSIGYNHTGKEYQTNASNRMADWLDLQRNSSSSHTKFASAKAMEKLNDFMAGKSMRQTLESVKSLVHPHASAMTLILTFLFIATVLIFVTGYLIFVKRRSRKLS